MQAQVKSAARQDVLDFYRQLPFNYSATPEQAASSIKAENPVPFIFPEAESLYDVDAVVEMGCGTGWLSNAINYYYGTRVTAVDFNQVAIDFGREVANVLGTDTKFCCHDLFSFEPEKSPELVISNGVLHHTDDCMGGITKCISLLSSGGGATVHRFVS